MKLVLTSDWHISERHSMGGANAGSAMSLIQFTDAVAQMTDVVRDLAEGGGDVVVIHLGDVFDRPRPTPREYMTAIRAVENIRRTGAKVHVIEGNHDRDSTQHALEPLLATLYGVEWTNAPESWVDLDVRLSFLPYPPPDVRANLDWQDRAERNAAMGELLDGWLCELAERGADDPDDMPHVLLAHCTFAGSRYGQTRTVGQWDLAVPTEGLDAFDAVFAGHLHVRQAIGSHPAAWYVGPLNQWSFSDEGIETGFAVYDCETRETTWHEVEGIRFQTIQHGEEMPAVGQNVIARVVGEVDSVEQFQRVDEQVGDLRTSSLSHVRNDVVIAKAAGTLRAATADTVRDVFDAYVEAKPEAVPEDMRGEVLAAAETIMERV